MRSSSLAGFDDQTGVRGALQETPPPSVIQHTWRPLT